MMGLFFPLWTIALALLVSGIEGEDSVKVDAAIAIVLVIFVMVRGSCEH